MRLRSAVARLAILVLFLSLVAGCAARSPVVHSPSQQPSSSSSTQPPPAQPLEVGEEPAEEVLAQDIPALEGEEQSAQPPPDEAVAAEEPVSASPLDQLADVEPELTQEELQKERDRAAAQAPTFDIPMQTSKEVLAWVDLYTGRFRGATEASLARSGRYMGMFRRIFAEAGLPQDLVYMAHVESGYKTTAYSRAHARGIFQFMVPTARRYGLRVDYWVDERSDPEKSARAAAAYMKDLYAQFGDWHLALAAYNAGEGKIGRALATSGLRDFWSLAGTRHIRRETKNHVPAILAAALISKQPEKYGLQQVDLHPPLTYDTMVVEGAADLAVLARCAGTGLETLKELNPALRRQQTPAGGRMDLRVPAGSAVLALAALADIPASERVLYTRYQVRRGDTLSKIAASHRVSVRAIQQNNQLGRKTVIHVGQHLRIPSSSAGQYASLEPERGAGSRSQAQLVAYRVKRGDTLSNIARRYHTSPAAIAAASQIPLHKVLHVGEKLKIVPRVSSPAVARRIAQPGAATAAAPRSSQAVATSAKVTHTVRHGESLWKIAARYGTSVAELCALNAIVPSSVIIPGTKLTVGYR